MSFPFLLFLHSYKIITIPSSREERLRYEAINPCTFCKKNHGCNPTMSLQVPRFSAGRGNLFDFSSRASNRETATSSGTAAYRRQLKGRSTTILSPRTERSVVEGSDLGANQISRQAAAWLEMTVWGLKLTLKGTGRTPRSDMCYSLHTVVSLRVPCFSTGRGNLIAPSPEIASLPSVVRNDMNFERLSKLLTFSSQSKIFGVP